MRTISLAYAAAPLLVVCGLAAQSVVVPSAAQTAAPKGNTWWAPYTFYATTATNSSRAQMIYDLNDISLPAGVFNSMDVRRPGLNQANSYLANTNPVMSMTAKIDLSISTAALGSVTNTFATNHGAMMTTVVNGTVNLPAGPASATWPHPWINIPFTTPFTFVKLPTGTLVVDVMQSANTATQPWYLEAQLPDLGGRNANGAAPSTCKNSAGQYASGLSYFTNLVPGSQWFVQYSGLPANSNGWAWLGAQGVGGTWGGLPLPFDLTPFGAPGCNVFASIDFVMPLTTTATGTARWPNINVPNTPSLGGQSFFEHSAWLDAAANSLGAVVGWSSRWAIGTQIGVPAAYVYTTTATSTTGTLTQQMGVSLRLNP